MHWVPGPGGEGEVLPSAGEGGPLAGGEDAEAEGEGAGGRRQAEEGQGRDRWP